MESYFSDLEVNTLILVVGEDSESLWVAKVEKICVRDEYSFPTIISVLQNMDQIRGRQNIYQKY